MWQTTTIRLSLAWIVVVLIYTTVHSQDTAPSQSQPAPRQPSRITIATYNVENLHDSHDDPYTFDEVIPPKSSEAIKQLTRVIRHLNADVLALQEVENEEFLRSMVREHLADMGYRHVIVFPTNSRHGLNLGILSRLPILNTTNHLFNEMKVAGHNHPRRFARGLVQVKIQATPNKTLDLFVVHFKARRDSPGDPLSTNWRAAEAAATRQVIQETLTNNPDAWIVLAGDMNATPDSPAMNVLLKPNQKNQTALHDLHAHLPLAKRITYLHKPHRTTVDYIFANSILANRVVPNTARVLSDKNLLSGSDHAPVVVTLDLQEQP